MSKLLHDAFKAAENLSEADQDAIARAVLRQVEEIEGREPVDRKAQLERILQKSPLHGRGEDFRQAAREFREGFRCGRGSVFRGPQGCGARGLDPYDL